LRIEVKHASRDLSMPQLQLDVRHHIQWRRHLVNAYEVEAGMVLGLCFALLCFAYCAAYIAK